MQLRDLEALAMIAAGVFTLNIVCAAIATSTVALVRSWRAEARRSTSSRHRGVEPRVRAVRRTKWRARAEGLGQVPISGTIR